MFGAFPEVAGAILRNSPLTCAVGGGLEYRLPGLPPVNFLEGAVAGLGLWLWGNPVGGPGKMLMAHII